jgi:hypothetical protein
MIPECVRVLRTPHSERYLLRNSGADIAAVDIHYLLDGTVQATLVAFDGAGLSEEDVPPLLTYVDEVLLPDVSLDDHKLLFTVVFGRVLGAYAAERDGADTSTFSGADTDSRD